MNAPQHPSSPACPEHSRRAPRHILVTGGAGFPSAWLRTSIGANLVRLLLDEGYQVRVLDNFSTGRREYLEGLDLEIMEGDIHVAEWVAEGESG